MKRRLLWMIVCVFLIMGCAGGSAESEAAAMNIPIEKIQAGGFQTDYFRFGHAVYDLAPDYIERMKEFLLRQ